MLALILKRQHQNKLSPKKRNFAQQQNPEKMSKVNPKIDLVFKKLFGSEENKDILLSLINAILPINQ